jgi:hypothetical protein
MGLLVDLEDAQLIMMRNIMFDLCEVQAFFGLTALSLSLFCCLVLVGLGRSASVAGFDYNFSCSRDDLNVVPVHVQETKLHTLRHWSTTTIRRREITG